MLKIIHFNRLLVLAASLMAAQPRSHAQNAGSSPAVAAVESGKPVNFRPANAELKPNETTLAPNAAPTAGSTDLEALIDRRDSLEAEIRYNQTKIEGDRKRVAVLQSLNNTEEAERLTVQIRDGETRVRNSRAQLAQVEEEVARLQNSSASAPMLGEEIILPGENLEVIVNEDGAFNGRYVVRRGGYIIMPGIGRISVAGKSVIQAERDISNALRQTQLKRATVTVERFQGASDEAGAVIYLAGEFQNPRPFRIPSGTSPTLISVLLSSGGWTDRADLDEAPRAR